METQTPSVLNDEEKRRIAARTRTLDDNLTTQHYEADVRVAETEKDWVDEWRDHVSEDEFGAFLERLDVSDLSVETCRRRLAEYRWPDGATLPNWLDHLDDLLVGVTTRDGELEFESDDANEVPFVHVLDAIVEHASERLAWSESGQLSTAARRAFERWLRERLESLLAHPLFIEFKTFVGVRDRELALAEDPEMPASPHKYYTSFVTDLLEADGFKSFFLEYSVLARQLTTTIEQWTEAIDAFDSRLANDRDAIRKTFGDGRPLGDIIDVDFLGDRHQNGQLVYGVEFESGTNVAYKPRNVEPEAAYNEFLSHVNESTDLIPLRTLDCLVREEYGWMEWVTPESCPSEAAVRDYYRRAGVQLCFLYALNFTDGHLENVLAAGDQPVLIDLETFCQPDLPMKKRTMGSPQHEVIRDSVLRTYVLPVNTGVSQMTDMNGLGKEEGKRTNVQIPEFERVNTDVMELTYRTEATKQGESLPQVAGERVEPTEHHEAIANGFERAYRYLLENRNELLREGGPIDAFDGIECRFLYRATAAYQSRLVHLTTPSHLRTGLTFGCRVEELSEPFATGSLDRAMWPLYEAERTALWRLDVPRFGIETDSTDVYHDGESVLEDGLDVSPYEQVSRRIRSLNEDDLQEQLDYVAFAYTDTKTIYPRSEADATDRRDETVDVESLTTEAAHDLFDRIQSSAHRTNDGELVWYLRESYERNGFNLHEMDDDLYNGRMGIGLFSAALAAVTGEVVYRDFTREVLTPIADELDAEDPFSEALIGAGHGIASFVYGFTKVDELLDSEWARRTATEFASLLTPDRMQTDSMLDVLNGSAGVVLATLALYDRTGDEDVLETAVTAGDYLLANRVEEDGYESWWTIHDRSLTGFSHGVAGVAYALFALWDQTGDARFRDAALESLQFEREAFSPSQGNWPNLNPDSEDEYALGWSAGSAGIGLARLGMYEREAREEFEVDVQRALENDDPDVLLDHDHVGHGNFGRVEFLLRAGQTLDDEQYEKQARELATAATRRADAVGRFTTLGQTKYWCNPSFFHAESGIGYSLLRVANPELPCILLWE